LEKVDFQNSSIVTTTDGHIDGRPVNISNKVFGSSWWMQFYNVAVAYTLACKSCEWTDLFIAIQMCHSKWTFLSLAFTS